MASNRGFLGSEKAFGFFGKYLFSYKMFCKKNILDVI